VAAQLRAFFIQVGRRRLTGLRGDANRCEEHKTEFERDQARRPLKEILLCRARNATMAFMPAAGWTGHGCEFHEYPKTTGKSGAVAAEPDSVRINF